MARLKKPGEEKAKSGRPSGYDYEKMEKLVETYLAENAEDTYKEVKDSNGKVIKTILKAKIPSIKRFSQFCGIPRTTLNDWAVAYKDFSELLDRIKKEQEARLVEKGLTGEYNPVMAKFILSARHEYREKTDTTSNGKTIFLSDVEAQKKADQILGYE